MKNREIDQNKKRVFKVLLLFTFITGILFASINMNRGYFQIATVEIIGSLISIYLLYLLKTLNAKKLHQLIVAYLTMFLFIMVFVFSSKGISTSIFVWVYIVPLVSYLLIEIRLGFVYTLVFYLLSFLVIYFNYKSQNIVIEKLAYLNSVITAFVIWGLAHTYEKTNTEAKALLRELAITDNLTGLYNRTSFNETFNKILKHCRRKNKKISLISLDLDLFKKINDDYGHETGDDVLKAFAEVIKNQIPKTATAFRIGGEEFTIIMPDDPKLNACEVAEKIRSYTEKIPNKIMHASCKVTVSSGVVIANTDDTKLDKLMKIADNRLYIAKEQGRNCIVDEG